MPITASPVGAPDDGICGAGFASTTGRGMAVLKQQSRRPSLLTQTGKDHGHDHPQDHS